MINSLSGNYFLCSSVQAQTRAVYEKLAAYNLYPIQNIDVLKEDSAAIYETRGSNGVVIIETRQGEE